MNNRGRKHLQEVLEKNPACYVLITCGELSEDGNMQVEMTYQGDATLASYLLQGAQFYMDQEEDYMDQEEDYLDSTIPPIQLVK